MDYDGLRRISVTDLLLDENNPRLAEPQSQSDILATWAHDPKNYKLAKNVAARGLSPLEVVAVIPHPTLKRRFIVVDGNRRLTALKLLHSPILAGDSSRIQRFRQLAGSHNLQQKVTCKVFASHAEADPWIELRHSGQAGGVGTVPWDSEQKYRFNERRNVPDRNARAVRFLDSAVEKGWISVAEQRAVPITTLRRVIDDVDDRRNLGIKITPEGPVVARPEVQATILVRTLVGALSKRGAVRSIDKKLIRNSFILDLIEKANLKPAGAEPPENKAEQPKPDKQGPSRRTPRKRAQNQVRSALAPRELAFTVSHTRCNEILEELQSIQIGRWPNAAVILFRVFVEFTTDYYLDRRGKRPSQKLSLVAKIRNCVSELDSTSEALTAPMKQAIEKILGSPNHPLHPDTLNAFVHNLELSPLPSDWPKLWDQIEPFLTAVWKSLEAMENK